uniref:Uncharacterized protein n=1 Tax=Candidatus Kentrum sp. MB TaxID=2138164 RepID=A0A450XM03_9GAMM|nr:MAG: hypothetical protein BECKMB1821I_GA0114274_101450 [Candidatus Kentron sp. MB]VFK75168.1 MAG: hypothetical protein BECKMB1821H_GA0114242_101650 [Candidatus Kentron sp. MB]
MQHHGTKILLKVKFYAYIILAVLAIVIFPVLAIIDAVDDRTLLALISFSLGGIIVLLLEDHASTFRKAFIPGADAYKQIGNEINKASQIWMLSYTSVMWINGDTFGEEFKKVFSSGGDNRILVYNPESEEYKNSLLHQIVDGPLNNPYRAENAAMMKRNFLQHLLHLTELSDVRVKAIDRMPSWNLLIFNPMDRARTHIFVILKTYATNGFRDPHIFSLTPHDGLVFEMFLSDFSKMWADAKEKDENHWTSLLHTTQ